MHIEIPNDLYETDQLDLHKLCNKHPEFISKLINDPLQYETLLNSKQLVNIPSALYIPDIITKRNYNKLIMVKGTIIKISAVEFRNIEEIFVCKKCDEVHVMQKKNNICMFCTHNEFRKTRNFDNITQRQFVKIQDVWSKGAIKIYDIIFEGSLVDDLVLGKRVAITGPVIFHILNDSFFNEKVNYKYFIKAKHVEFLDNYEFKAEEKFIVDYRNVENKRKHILSLFCPKIYGINHVKLGIILSLLASTNEDERTNSHILLVGDTATGKSELLTYASNLITPSRLLNGFTVSKVGLTACAIKQGRDWSLEAGALVVCDGGLCCIDHFEALKATEKTALMEVMEQQLVTVSKSGMNLSFRSRCSILASVTIKDRLKRKFCLKSDSKISTPLLSRFDLIFRLTDESNPILDSMVADIALEKKQEEDTTIIQEIINYLRTLDVEEDNENNDIILKYYRLKRLSDIGNEEFYTVRFVEGLSRLSKLHAKLCMKDCVDKEDIFVAIFLNECSFRGIKMVYFDEERIFTDKEYFDDIMEGYIRELNKF